MAGIFSPMTIKELNLCNRIVMPPMATHLSTPEGAATAELIEHYVLRAQASVGLCIVEHTFITGKGRVHPHQLGLYSDAAAADYCQLTGAVHAVGGRIGIQISHGGSACSREVIGTQPVGPSSIRHPRGKDVPREMTPDEIAETAADFGKAAVRARDAGFDLVEIHGAHGYLLNQFFSPLTNKRNDTYGGSRENRIRFLVEVVEAVREALGKEYPLAFRLAGDDRMYGGLGEDDARWAALRLVRHGVDVIDLSGGLGGYDGQGQGYFVYLAEAVKQVVDIPVMVSGGIKDPLFANRLVETGKTDLVGVGRALLEDPHWAQKALGACLELQRSGYLTQPFQQ